MLNDYKKLYREQADFIPGWEKINKNELCNMYLDETDTFKKECILSAIVCRYWCVLDGLYKKSFQIATENDCYDWLIRAIMYALDKKQWRNPNSKLYGDKNGPDKAINVTLKCTRLTFFQVHNHLNKKANNMTSSLDELEEEYDDLFAPETFDLDTEFENEFKKIVHDLFTKTDCSCITNKKLLFSSDIIYDNVFAAFIVDSIAYEDVFGNSKDGFMFSIKKFIKSIREYPKEFVDMFSSRYEVNREKVEETIEYFSNLTSEEICGIIDATMKYLRTNERLREMITDVN